MTAERIGGSYFKSGDFTYRLRVTPGTPENPDFPVLEFVKRDPNFSNAFSALHTFRLDAPAADGTYTLTDSGGRADRGDPSPLTGRWADPWVLRGEMEEAGDLLSPGLGTRSCRSSLPVP